MVFDSDATTVLLDNCSNTHICNDKKAFIHFESEVQDSVNNIGGKSKAQGIGIVRWSWTDDEGKVHQRDFKNVRYYLDSSVNVISMQ